MQDMCRYKISASLIFLTVNIHDVICEAWKEETVDRQQVNQVITLYT